MFDNAIGFAPELLPAEFGYAVLAPDSDGRLRERTDRWDQALVLSRIAAECFTAATDPRPANVDNRASQG